MKAQGKAMLLSIEDVDMNDQNEEKNRMYKCRFDLVESESTVEIFVSEKFHADTFKVVDGLSKYTLCELQGNIIADKMGKPKFKLAGLKVAK